MKEIEMLRELFKPNEPILFEEIIELFSDRSRQWIYNTLKAMIASRNLQGFQQACNTFPNM